MKQYLLLMPLLSFLFFSCQKTDIISDAEYTADKNIAGEYEGIFSWSKNNSARSFQTGEENLHGTFSITYTGNRNLQVRSNISSGLKYKVYEMTLSKVKQADNHIEYYFTGMAKDYTEKVSSFAEMSLITSAGKYEFSFYGCNSFDGVSGESLRITDATLIRL